MVLDVDLIDVLGREIAGAALPEVRQSDRARDAGPFPGRFEDLSEHPGADRLRLRELAPQRRVPVFPVRVIVEPPLEVGDGERQRGRALPPLALDCDLHTVRAIGDVADLDVLKFEGRAPRFHAVAMIAASREFRVSSIIGRTSSSQRSMSAGRGEGS